MTEISFDDLIPQGEPKAAALPVEGSVAKTAGPFTVTPQVTEAPKAPDISFDDLIPKGVTGGGWKRNAEAKPEEMSGRERAYREGRAASAAKPADPFEGESLGSTLKRRGQQAARGFGNVVAGVPEAVGIIGSVAQERMRE